MIFIALVAIVLAFLLGRCSKRGTNQRASLNLRAHVAGGPSDGRKELRMSRIERTPITFSDAQRSLFSIAPLDAQGNPDNTGPFAWSVTEEIAGGSATQAIYHPQTGQLMNPVADNRQHGQVPAPSPAASRVQSPGYSGRYPNANRALVFGEVLSITPAADGLSADVVANAVGTAVVEVTKGELTEFIRVTITSGGGTGDLASLNLSAGSPTQK